MKFPCFGQFPPDLGVIRFLSRMLRSWGRHEHSPNWQKSGKLPGVLACKPAAKSRISLVSFSTQGFRASVVLGFRA